MHTYNAGIYQYSDYTSPLMEQKLPSSLTFLSPSEEAVLLRLLLGKIKINSICSQKELVQKCNYTILPFQSVNRTTYKAINKALSIDDVLDQDTQLYCNKYFTMNRKNAQVHRNILFEITAYFFESASPVSAFVHIYRCLEYMSYCFPLMYASLTRNYRGTYDSLKEFLSGKDTGELKFMKKFLDELFRDDPINLYQFDISIEGIYNTSSLRAECERAFNQGFIYSFSDECFSVNFSGMISLIIILRNRYFHYLVGMGQNNFSSTNYDISQFFSVLNPYFINWITIIFCKIVQFGVNSIS